MQLQSLKLRNFKNYEAADLEFHPRLNLIIGMNGVGKTNLLDAIYYMAFGKSFYHIPDRQLIRFSAHEEMEDPFFRIEGKTDGPAHYAFSYNSMRKKQAQKNKVIYERISDHIGEILLVSIFPEDLNIIKQDSSLRRRFADSTIGQVDKSYLMALMKYNRILKHKNELLKNFSMAAADKSLLLDKYDRDLVPLIREIGETRQSFAEEFEPVYQDFYSGIAPVGGEYSGFRYTASVPADRVEETLKNSRRQDWDRGRASKGPHRDDFKIMLKGNAAKYFASQGQQKSILFSLKLAQYRYIARQSRKKPLLLLDDIFEKLDFSRILNLMALLAGDEIGQIFITDTDAERMEQIAKEAGLEYKFIAITHQNHE